MASRAFSTSTSSNHFTVYFRVNILFRCLVKTHAEGVVESMGNYVELHADTRRGRMDISDIGKEAMIHWNGPPIAMADTLGEAALDRHFGRNRLYWMTL